MGVLENVRKMSSEEVLEKVETFGVVQYGLYHKKLWDVLTIAIEECKEEKVQPGIVCALDNADTDGVLLEVLIQNPEKVMEGIAIAAQALKTEKRILYLPEYAVQLAESEKIKEVAENCEIEVRTGLVDVRDNIGCAMIHIVTAVDLSDMFNNCYEAGVYVSVNGTSVKKVSADTNIGKLTTVNDVKAIQIGYQYYTPLEVETMTAKDTSNGVIRILTDKDCIVIETEKRLLASRKQSCGKCVFCREGLLQLQAMQKDILDGKGKLEYLDMTKEIGEAMTFSTPCTMGQVSSEIVLTAIEKFGAEFETHIRKKTCLAGVCFSTETFYINPKTCEGCGECMDVCPKDCIEGKSGYIHMIDEFDCDRCGKCMEVCESESIIKTAGKLPKLPNRLTKTGKFKR